MHNNIESTLRTHAAIYC